MDNDQPAVPSPAALAADAVGEETVARRVMEPMSDVRLDENMALVQIDVEGVQAASYDASAAQYDDGDIYTFLSRYLPPEDVAYLRQTDEESQLSASLEADALFAGIEARVRSQERSVAGFDGGAHESAAAVSAASVAAIGGLERVTYGGSEGDAGCGTGCVICVQDYEVEDELSVVPCSGRHRFHRKCIAEWLACSHVCPLCRHALPTEGSQNDERASDGTINQLPDFE